MPAAARLEAAVALLGSIVQLIWMCTYASGPSKMVPLVQVKLVDAGFVWTEPHSRRIKVKLTIQAEVMNGAILQQTFVIEFVVEPHMCMDCTRANTNSSIWTACAQVSMFCQLVAIHRDVRLKPVLTAQGSCCLHSHCRCGSTRATSAPSSSWSSSS